MSKDITEWAMHLTERMREAGKTFDRANKVRVQDVSEYVTRSKGYTEKRVRLMMKKGLSECEAWKKDIDAEVERVMMIAHGEDTFWEAYEKGREKTHAPSKYSYKDKHKIALTADPKVREDNWVGCFEAQMGLRTPTDQGLKKAFHERHEAFKEIHRQIMRAEGGK